MRRVNLRIRILAPLTLVLLALAILLPASLYQLKQHEFETDMDHHLEMVGQLLERELQAKAEVMAAALERIMHDEIPPLSGKLREIWLRRDRQALLDYTERLYEQLHLKHGITHFYFTEPGRINFLRVHNPDKHGDTIDRHTMRQAEESGEPASGIELGPLGTFTLRQVIPWYADGEIIGYLELGMEIEEIIASLKRILNVELVVIIGKRFLDRDQWESGMRMLGRDFSWEKFPAVVRIAQTTPTLPAELEQHFRQGEEILTAEHRHQEIAHAGRTYHASSLHLHDAAGLHVGRMVILHDISDELAAIRKFTGIVVAACLAGGILLWLIFYRILRRTEQEIEESEEKFRKLGATARDAILSMDSQGRVSYWNPAAERMFGFSAAEATGQALHELIIPEAMRQAHCQALPAFLETGQGAVIGQTVELTALRKDGTEFPVELSLSSMRIRGEWHAAGIIRDITSRKLEEQRTRRAYEVQRVLDTILNITLPPLSLKELLARSLDAILTSISEFSMLKMGAIFLKADGTERLELAAQRNLPESLQASCELVPFGHCLCGRAASERQIIFAGRVDERHENRYAGMEDHGHYCTPIVAGNELLGVFTTYVEAGHAESDEDKLNLRTIADTLAAVIERKRAYEQLEQMAHNDALTGLPNRALFFDRLDRVMAMARRQKQGFAVLFMDLDRFKEVNDTLGHDAGDELLKQVSTRLLGCVREADTVARMGGDEFTIILNDIHEPASAGMVAEKVLKELTRPFPIAGEGCRIGTSIGIALYPADGEDSETLLRQADEAMYRAKQQGNAFCYAGSPGA